MLGGGGVWGALSREGGGGQKKLSGHPDFLFLNSFFFPLPPPPQDELKRCGVRASVNVKKKRARCSLHSTTLTKFSVVVTAAAGGGWENERMASHTARTAAGPSSSRPLRLMRSGPLAAARPRTNSAASSADSGAAARRFLLFLRLLLC